MKEALVSKFQDDILEDSMGGLRQYQMIENANGTTSPVDVSEYKQVGTEYGATQANAQRDFNIAQIFEGNSPISKTTTFNPDGSILDTYTDGTTAKTVFNEDGSISVELSVDGELVATKTTTFNSDGSISDTVEEE